MEIPPELMEISPDLWATLLTSLGSFAGDKIWDGVKDALKSKDKKKIEELLKDIRNKAYETNTLVKDLQNETSELLRNAAHDLKPLIEKLHVNSAHTVLDNLRTKVRDGDREAYSRIDYYRGCCSRYVNIARCMDEFDLAYREMTDRHGNDPEIISGKICAHCMRKDQYQATNAANGLKPVRRNNPWAWVPDLLFAKDLAEAYNSLPEDIDRRLVLAHAATLWDDPDLRSQSYRLIDPVAPDTLTFENIPIWILVQLALIDKFYSEWYKSFYNFATEPGEACKSFYEVSSRYLSLVGKTELGDIIPDIRLFHLVAGYKIKKDPEILSELIDYECSPDSVPFKQLSFASYLIEAKRYDDVRAFFNRPDIQLGSAILYARFYFAHITGDLDYVKETLRILVENNVEMRGELLAYFLFALVHNYDTLKEDAAQVRVTDEINAKAYQEILHSLDHSPVDTQFLLEYEQRIVSPMRPFVAIALHHAGLTEEALELSESCVKDGVVGICSVLYFSLLERSNAKQRMDSFLKRVRENGYTENGYWLNAEYELASEKEDYPRMVEITSSLLKLDPDNASVFVAHLYSQYRNGDFDKVKELSEHLDAFQFREEEVLYVVDALVYSGLKEKAIDFLYKTIKSSPFSEKLNLIYHGACRTPELFQIIEKEYDWVDDGMYVTYKHNGSLTSSIVAKDMRTSCMIGKKPGDVAPIPDRKGGLETYEIVRIQNKYYKLWEEINKDIEDNKYQSVLSIPMMDVKPEDLLSSVSRTEREDRWVRHYLPKVSSFLKGQDSWIHVFNDDDPISEYYNRLFGDYRVYSISSDDFEQRYHWWSIDINQQAFVLDLSAVVLLYELHLKFGLEYSFPMIVSQGLVSFIEKCIENEAQGSSGAVLPCVVDLLAPCEVNTGQTWYMLRLKGLLGWVKDNATIEEPHELPGLDSDTFSDFYTKYSTVHCISLAQQEGRCMVSEDLTLLFFTSNLVVSSDVNYLIRTFCKDHSKEVSTFLLQSNIFGCDIDLDFVYSQYEKHGRGESSLFPQCRENLSYTSSMFMVTFDFCYRLYNKKVITSADALLVDSLLIAVFKHTTRTTATAMMPHLINEFPLMEQALVSAYNTVYPVFVAEANA